ncbi:flagellar basal body P-ring formation chaperone FlgA [Zavarzinella formosa]|uniref:flagellar basal body P-ring formation chaperone FlgA n=1 Tax=Zavarzinella formosa TaxID=360055 RepID=UPI0002D9DE9D|nr:flagellar basal body P-ring formation chaperone FlgA [Zavarzinella formosa]
MNAHSGFRFPAALAVLWWLAGLGIDISAEAPKGPEGIVITMREKVAIPGRAITLGDVAEISGGSEHARLQIGRLDLADFGGATNVNIRRRQVEFRLRLADFPTKLFSVVGAEETMVAAIRQPLSPEGIFQTAKDAALKRMPWPAEDLAVRLVQPITAPLPSVSDPSEVTMRAEPHTANVNIGRVQIDVTLFVLGEKKLSLPVYLEIKLMRSVIMARSGLAKGDILSEANTVPDRRVVDPGLSPLPPGELMGRKTKRPVAIGQVIQEADLETAPLEIPAAVVRNKQPVKMLVRLGAVNVVANGEALQGGKTGDLIRVQNIDSKKVVVGRITGPDTVEVE